MTHEPLGLVVDITANIEKLERAIEDQFKPALARAIEEVTESFIKAALGGCVEISEPHQQEPYSTLVEFGDPTGYRRANEAQAAEIVAKIKATSKPMPRFPNGGIVGERNQ